MVRSSTPGRGHVYFLLALATACATVGGGAHPRALFDGSSLAGWDGDPRFWSVQDGVLVGESTPANPCERTTYLVWRGGTLGDFDLSLEYRIRGGNSGIQFRSRGTGKWDVEGYQADLDAANEWTGGLYEQGGRGVVARRGERVALLSGGGREVVRIPDADAALAAGSPDGWNRCRVVARGERLEISVNGVLTSTITDRSPEASPAGLLALQLHQGEPMRVEFRDIELVDLGGAQAPTATAERTGPRWIWSHDDPQGSEEAWFRTTFDAPADVVGATLWATCDNRMELFLNGESVAQSDQWEHPLRIDVKEALRPGRNTLAAWGANDGGPAGLCAKLTLETAGGGETAVWTGAGWLAAREDPGPGWNAPRVDDAGAWEPAHDVGPLGKEPWGALGEGSDYVPEVALAAEELALQPGFRAELLYSVPRLHQGSWVSLTADDRGRLYASDQYGRLYRVTPGAPGTKGAAVTVEDVDVDLGEAHGLCWAFDALYVVVSSDRYQSGLYRVRDTDGDDRLDRVERLATFHGSGEHGPHAVVAGPDGKSLYVIAGNHTSFPDYVERSRVPRLWQEDSLLPRMPDPNGHAVGKLAPGGWICRTDPDGEEWELIASGMRNSYDFDFDPDGELFTYDADMEWDIGLPWYRPPRILHLVSGAEFGWRNGSGKWPTYYPDSLPSVVDTGPASPTGVVFGTRTSFPERWQRALYAADWAYGTIHAIHLEPKGSSFTGTAEPFVSGRPLPVTDLAVAPDGALYFTTGGRRTQSGLYRVTWVGDDTAAVQASAPRPSSAVAARQRRRAIEGFHDPRVPLVPGFVWEGLGDEDRFVRFAARVVLEQADLEGWKDRALAEETPRASIEGILALVRRGGGDADAAIFEHILGWPWDELDEETELAALRVVELALLRLEPDEDVRARITELLAPRFPDGRERMDHELCRLLAYLDHPGLAQAAVPLLEAAATQEDAIDYAASLRVLRDGWDEGTRARYLAKLEELVASATGGASVHGYVVHIRDDARETLGVGEEAEAEGEAPQAAASPEPERPAPALVRHWTVEGLLPAMARVGSARSFERGLEVYTSARCAECHRTGGQGQAVGPDLSGAGNRYTPHDLLQSIIEPSLVISDTYRDTEVWTRDDRVFVGRVEDASDGVIRLRTPPPDDELVEIPEEEVAEQREHPLSRMPEGLLDTLTEDQILDLCAFVLSGGDPDDPAFRADGGDDE